MNEKQEPQMPEDVKLVEAAGGLKTPDMPVYRPSFTVAPTETVIACKKCGYFCSVTMLKFTCPRCGCQDYYIL